VSQNQNPPTRESPPAIMRPDARLLAAMYGTPQKKKTDLLKYWPLIWAKRRIFFLLLLVVALFSGWRIYSMPTLFKATVLISPVGEEGRASHRFRRFAGIAAMAGISTNVGRSSSRVNLAILKSRSFLETFVEKNKLKTILFARQWDKENKSWRKKEPRQSMLIRRMKTAIHVNTNKKTGLITITVSWRDAKIAATWANNLVAGLNDYLRQQAMQRSRQRLGYLNNELARTKVAGVRQALFALISHELRKTILINSQKQYAFRIVDPAVPPDKPFKSKRRILFIVIQLTVYVGFLTAIGFVGYYLGRRSKR